MTLLLQSKSFGEVIYPYLASLYAGYLRKNGKTYTFSDLNITPEFIKNGFCDVVIFISWISITRYKKNLDALNILIEKLNRKNVTVICESPEISKLLNQNEIEAKFIHEVILVDDVISDFAIARPENYLSPIFSNNQYLPLINSFYKEGKYIHRRVECILKEISLANHLYSITNFFFEDDFKESSKEYLASLFKATSSLEPDVHFVLLGNSSLESIRGIPVNILKKSKCDVASFLVTHHSQDCIEIFNKLEEAQIKSCAYIEIPLVEKSIFFNLIYIIKSIHYPTVINHYYCMDGTYLKTTLFTFLGYLLSLIEPRRMIFIAKYTFLSANNFKKLVLKLKRIVN